MCCVSVDCRTATHVAEKQGTEIKRKEIRKRTLPDDTTGAMPRLSAPTQLVPATQETPILAPPAHNGAEPAHDAGRAPHR